MVIFYVHLFLCCFVGRCGSGASPLSVPPSPSQTSTPVVPRVHSTVSTHTPTQHHQSHHQLPLATSCNSAADTDTLKGVGIRFWFALPTVILYYYSCIFKVFIIKIHYYIWICNLKFVYLEYTTFILDYYQQISARYFLLDC